MPAVVLLSAALMKSSVVRSKRQSPGASTELTGYGVGSHRDRKFSLACRVEGTSFEGTVRSRPGARDTDPSARCATGMSRLDGRQAFPSKVFSTVIRR